MIEVNAVMFLIWYLIGMIGVIAVHIIVYFELEDDFIYTLKNFITDVFVCFSGLLIFGLIVGVLCNRYCVTDKILFKCKSFKSKGGV